MSERQKKLSGHQYKQRRLEKEVQIQKQAGALKNYLQRTSRTPETNDNSECPTLNPEVAENTESRKTNDDQQMDDISTATGSGTTLLPNETTKIDTNLSHTESAVQPLSTDPALWPRILGDVDRTFLVRQAPPRLLYNHNFPPDDTGRKFSATYYRRILTNGEHVKHIVETLKEHEVSKNHIEAHKSWLELSQRLKCWKPIDATAPRIINADTNHWYEVLLRIERIIKMLGKSCLAFQGTSDKLFEHNNDNFLKVVELLSEFDPIMEEDVRRVVKKEETKAHYLGKNIENEIIDLLHQNVKSYIINEIKKAKYYSIILDCTPDVSKVKQMTLIIRYVTVNKSDFNDAEIKVNGSFLGFLPIERSTGKQMTEIIIEELTNMGLNLQDIRGQGYDNGSNMKGDKAGVQSKIKNLNSRAFYVPCASHSLNLVVNDMPKASSVAANFFNIIQKLYFFFHHLRFGGQYF
ncbi:zinc finger MYM-type protein 1-like [Onthophagus taurus]|uniref:zinc finger MYM-type protein 1-like n=1 Tax=Onthophagus taurus TaxID=166361 RepID=UPI0039BE5BD6